MKPGTLKIKTVRTILNALVTIVFICGDCGCSHAQERQGKDMAKQIEKGFTLPDISQLLTAPKERAEYMVAHYWDHFDFADTTLISRPEITEQALADFINILPHVPYRKAESALTALMDSASVGSTMFAHFIELSEKYLEDPNSPFRNEEYYIPVLRYIVASAKLDEVNKIRPQYQLEQALKNRPGELAADFTYTLADGRSAKMSSLKADYTVLYFNNPDCPDCKRVKDYIAASPLFGQMVQSGRLAVLAVYPDADIPLWKQGSYPKLMINSYDAGQAINKKQLYNLKAIPMLYLLDKEKQVILKDAPVEAIEAWLQALLTR